METTHVGKTPALGSSGSPRKGDKIASARLGGKRRWAIWRFAAVAALLLAGATWHASWRVPTGPANGESIEGAAVSSSDVRTTLRVAAFNVHGCKGQDGRRDVDRVSQCLRGFDVAALNEVHRAVWRGPEDQASQIAGHLGAASVFAPAESLWYGAMQSGNALVTMPPVRWWYRIPLPRAFDRSYRNLVLACVEHRGRPIHVLATHVVRRDDRERQAQLRAAIAIFLALAEPAILLGDLNSLADDPQMRQLLAAAGVEDPLGRQLGSQPAGRIDWILTRGLRTVDAGVIDRGASDHPLIWAEFDFPSAGGSDAR
jgi:endonuclease/exonuclease/phosphatase family metal-dependent hydrolase